jgi:ABC-type dipeptide/oligopeptide/nickel transport system ATPase subunit
MNGEPLVRTENLTKYYTTEDGFFDRLLGESKDVKAVDGVDIEVHEGETLGLVGESGCGKSSLGRTLLQLEEPTAGAAYYRDGEEEVDLASLSSGEMREYRKELQMIFQNPFASLNPRLTVADIVGEPLDVHGLASGRARRERIEELLDLVGMQPSHASRYPHEFSGGQRQRIGIARALAVDPDFIVCDEPISALGRIVGEAVNVDRLGDRLPHRHARIEGRVRVLKDDLHPPPNGAELRLFARRAVLAFEGDASAGRIEQTQNRPSERGLAAPRFADETECFPLADVEAHVVDGANVSLHARKRAVKFDRGRYALGFGPGNLLREMLLDVLNRNEGLGGGHALSSALFSDSATGAAPTGK